MAEAPERGLWELADIVTPMAVRVAATLRLADHIAAATDTATRLAAATGTELRALDSLLAHLASVGVFERLGDGRFGLTPRGEELRDAHPGGIRAVMDIEGPLGRADLAFLDLLGSVRTGEAAFPRQFGRPFWSDLASDAGRTAGYDAQMGRDVARWAPDIVEAYPWGEFEYVVDVGGGDGTLMAAILDAFPFLSGVVFDQPTAAEAAGNRFADPRLGDRGSAVGGNFFDALPPGADAYLLCAILHDWDDASAVAILGRCAEAAGGSGRVFVIEKTGADGESPSTSMGLRMLVYFGGHQRGVAELTGLARRAGLGTMAVHQAGDLSVIELVPFP